MEETPRIVLEAVGGDDEVVEMKSPTLDVRSSIQKTNFKALFFSPPTPTGPNSSFAQVLQQVNDIQHLRTRVSKTSKSKPVNTVKKKKKGRKKAKKKKYVVKVASSSKKVDNALKLSVKDFDEREKVRTRLLKVEKRRSPPISPRDKIRLKKFLN